jgi:hypothetical protein
MTVPARASRADGEHTRASVPEAPVGRWRSTSPAMVRGAADRVRVSHTQTRITLRIALGFVAAAAVAAVAGDGRWLVLHLFLAGAVALAISGVSLMLTEVSGRRRASKAPSCRA